MQIRLQDTKVRKQIQIITFATFFLPDFETFGGSLGRSTVAHFARKVRGANIAAAKYELKIQQSHAKKRWSCSLRVRGPHVASKVSYNAGAATSDCASQRKFPLRGCCRQPFIFPNFAHLCLSANAGAGTTESGSRDERVWDLIRARPGAEALTKIGFELAKQVFCFQGDMRNP